MLCVLGNSLVMGWLGSGARMVPRSSAGGGWGGASAWRMGM